MARVPTSTSRTRAVTTYKSKKTSPSTRTLGSNLKNSASKASPQSNLKKATVKNGKGFVVANSVNEEESTDSEEEGIDPNLKALVKQSGLTSRRVKLKPSDETPTTSRTLVNRQTSRFPPPGTSTSKSSDPNSKIRKTAVQHSESDDDDTDELSFSNDGSDDDMEDYRQKIVDLKKKAKSLVTTDTAQIGKENIDLKGATASHARERGQGRKFGQAIQAHTERSHATRGKPYDHPITTVRHTTKSRAQPEFQDPPISKPTLLTRTYDMASSGTEGSESSDDQRVFVIKGHQSDRLVREHGRGDISRNTRHRLATREDGDSSEDAEEHHAHGHVRAEIDVDVKYVTSVFKDMRKTMQSHANNVQERFYEELQPIQRATEKLYKILGGAYTEKMLAQQSLMEKALEKHCETLHMAKRDTMERQETLKGTMLELKGEYARIQERKKKLLEKARRQIIDLEKKRAKDIESLEAEFQQARDKAKTKAEKLLDPTVLNAKFAKQRKYIYQEVGL